ncbi:ABC-2 transporter permease, partial [Sporosarcina sp. NCCP-2222]|uniref:ABC-2 transporter permease n=1 Tax=Sporosarcina sp. NCCP-2222 TaxID=2935073 RepID=UPI0020C0CFDE
METNFAGSIHLFRFILRKSWLYITIWLLGISCMTLIVPLSFSELYPTQQARDVMAETMRNPAMTAMVGPGHLENYTIGAMVSHQMLLLTSVAVAIMNFLLIVKHTRAEEEDGRTELLSSLPISRKSQLVAALFVLLPLNMLLAVLIGFGLFGLGIEDMNLAGSLWYGAVLGASGLFFGGVAAVCSQLLESSRSAIGLSFTFMLITFLLRTSGQEWLTWTTPFGLVTLVQPFSVNNGW